MNEFDEYSKAGKQLMDNGLKSFAAITKGLQNIAGETTDYSRASFERFNALVEKLSGAKSLENAFEIQADYMKTSYENFVSQSTKLNGLMADLAKEAYQPYESSVASAK